MPMHHLMARHQLLLKAIWFVFFLFNFYSCKEHLRLVLYTETRQFELWQPQRPYCNFVKKRNSQSLCHVHIPTTLHTHLGSNCSFRSLEKHDTHVLHPQLCNLSAGLQRAAKRSAFRHHKVTNIIHACQK